MTLAAPPPSLAAIAAAVEGRLATVLAAEQARWASFDPDLSDVVAEIGRLVQAGGKRLRPAFCHWGYVAAGGDPAGVAGTPGPVEAGAALELMHAFALFHDDVMDDAPSRRGSVTTHTRFATVHHEQHWAGESRRFGEGVAILVGDLAFVLSDQLLIGANRAAWAVWNELRAELNIGQLLDIVGSARNDRGLDKALRICRYKSGKYTIERPLHLGAVLADEERGAELGDALSAYGLPLGDAFQMRDDVMGAFGDERLTGKPVGADLREAKPTPLLAVAVARASAPQAEVLRRVGRQRLDDAAVAEVQQAIVDSGALAELEARISALTDEAISAIRRAPVARHAVEELVELAHYVSWRTT